MCFLIAIIIFSSDVFSNNSGHDGGSGGKCSSSSNSIGGSLQSKMKICATLAHSGKAEF